MVWVHKKSFLHRFTALCVALIATLFSCMPAAFASPAAGGSGGSGGDDSGASSAESVGTSLYSVSTALTAFANNVVGANTNDKHADLGSAADPTLGSFAGSNVDHKLYELTFGSVGDAGSIIGYGDATKGFVGYISSNETRAVTTSSYGAYQNVGDKGRAYAYARYGRLLNDLGIDATGNPSGAGAMRKAGHLVQVTYLVSSFIPKAFNVSLGFLKILNPFRFLVNQEAVSDVLTDTGKTESLTDAFGDVDVDNTLPTGDVTAEQIQGVDEFGSGPDDGAFGTALNKLAKIPTQIYVMTQAMGIYIIIPLLLVFFLASVLMTSNGQKRIGSKALNLGIKIAFICIGIPLLGALYTSVLDTATDITDTDVPTGRIIAATFVDFENWARDLRLEPPNGAHFVSENVGNNQSEAQGRADGDSWRTVRDSIYKINRSLDSIYGDLPANSGFGLTTSSSGAGYQFDSYAGTWDTNGNFQAFGDSDVTRKSIFSLLNAMTSTYASGSFYTASAWESNVNSVMTSKYSADLGGIQSTEAAAADPTAMGATIYQMYFDTDEVDDWMDRAVADNAKIFANADVGGGASADPTAVEAAWADGSKDWNIFSNGSNLGVTLPVVNDDGSMPNSSITYTGTVSTSQAGVDPGKKDLGLSTVSMYNYLSSAFNQSNISVYSATNTTSEYTRMQHYSVNIAGSGITSALFMLNVIAVLGVFVVLGLFYCFGMLISNIKTGFSMLLKIPFSMLGMLQSIVQVCIYVVSMVVELVGTVFLYQFVMELVVTIATVIEGPIMNTVQDLQAASLVGGLFAFMQKMPALEQLVSSRAIFAVGLGAVILAVLLIGLVSVKLHRAVLVAYAYVKLKALRLMTYKELRPAFDAWAAQRKSLYIWEELADDLEDASEKAQKAPCYTAELRGGAQS